MNYYEIDAVSSGNLADFYLDGGDRVLEKKPPSLPFEMGKAFERFVQDASTGSERFFERFFVADVDAPMPKELPGWIGDFIAEWAEYCENDVEMSQEWKEWCYAKDLYKTTKTGKLDARFSSRHAWLDICGRHPGKYPISMADLKAFESMLISLRKIRPFQYNEHVTLGDILSWPSTFWQYPVVWINENGVKCKILLDIVAFPKDNGFPSVLPIDLKWTQKIDTFEGNFRRRYWIQERHYTAGAKANWPGRQVLPMLFPVSIHKLPYKSTLRRLDKNSMEKAQGEYEQLVIDYANWEASGRRPTGYYKPRALRPWV
jgi:hypothetical protein